MCKFGGKESRANRSTGYNGGYVLAGAESCRKVAIIARVVMLGGGVIV